MNRIPARIVSVESEGPVSLIGAEAAGCGLSVLVVKQDESLPYAAGAPVDLLFTENEAILSLDPDPDISIINRLRGVVAGLVPDGLLCRVLVDAGAVRIYSLVTARAASRLDLCRGSRVTVLVKPSAIIIAERDHGR